ncbi:MAG: hypothetical protein ACRYG8_24395, partial [Janthinobacterium lividum]
VQRHTTSMISQHDEIAWDRFERTLILGNSGSGKSWLAAKVAEALGSKAVDLDAIHWEPGGYSVARNKQVAIGMVHQEALGAAWVIEGVFGWLAQEAVSRATALVWPNIPIGECLDNIRHRGLRRGGDAASFSALLDWAGYYEKRQTSSSHAGHLRMFNDFPLQKLRLSSRDAVTHFIAKFGGRRTA